MTTDAAMDPIRGDDVPDTFGRVTGYGVCGTGRPAVIDDRDGPTPVM